MKPQILTSYPSVQSESKNEKVKRHQKERKDLELYIRQQKVANKIGNAWLAELKQLQQQSDQVEEVDNTEQMLLEIRQNNAVLQKKAEKTLNSLNKQSDLDKAMNEYRRTEKTSDKEWELAKLTAVLAENKRQMRYIQADGNCLYSSLEHALKTSNLRQRLHAYIVQTPSAQLLVKDVYADLNEYLVGLKSTEWGDELEIALLSTHLKVKIIVYNAFMRPIVYGEENTNSAEIVFCRYQIPGAAHYNGVDSL
ncbi:OTU-like_cysteine protease domain-containing protein [Hexamita inflata]|uniref:OTU-like_cysteine protease domain-containing protein n=1 Tax=Hexamita inflata TaxID=28002 RepID=A0ABP1HBB5_9EUKA